MALSRPKIPKGTRLLRSRNDSDDDTALVDWTKSPKQILYDILWQIVQKDNISKSQKLGYLSCFNKYCIKYKDFDFKTLDFSFEDIFLCLRTTFFHESVEVRAAGIRSIRYFVKNEDHVKSLYKINLDYLIARSIDIVLDNKAERMQALRLIRKLLSVSPKNFSAGLTRCMIAIARDGHLKEQKDEVLRTCLATLSEVLLLNPEIGIKCNTISALMDSILNSDHSFNITEAIIGSFLYLINNPKLRTQIKPEINLHYFIGIFTDYARFSSNPTNTNKSHKIFFNDDSKDFRISVAKNVLISIFRSWPGFLYMCKTNTYDLLLYQNLIDGDIQNQLIQSHTQTQNLNGLQSLIQMLHLPFEDTKKCIMEFIFELFYIPIPEWTDDFDVALFSTNLQSMHESWQLSNDFVAAEGKVLLPYLSNNRQNLADNYLALLLYAFLSYGILDGLVSVIVESKKVHNSVRATVLLGELLHLCNQILPPEISLICHTLSRLVKTCVSNEFSLQQRTLSNAAMSCLNLMHSLKKRPILPCSLFLEQLIQFKDTTFKSSYYDVMLGKIKMKDPQIKARENDENSVIQCIKHSQVLIKEFSYWDWALIGFVLKISNDSFKKLDDTMHKVFIKKLIHFYKPSSRLFSNINAKNFNAREICSIGVYLIDFLLDCDESKSFEYIDDLIGDIQQCLYEIISDDSPPNIVLNPTKMISTLSGHFFLFIGKLTNSSKGKKILEKSKIYQYLIDLTSHNTSKVYVKLMVSSLDYNQEGFTRSLLRKLLSCNCDISRLYATKFLRVIMRTQILNFHQWGIELLIQQLNDKQDAVCLAAIDILDEACDNLDNLKALISLRPSLLHLKDQGILLFSRFVSCEEGFIYLQDSNLINVELDRWKNTFYLKYVYLVEDILNESFTFHKKSEDGTYGRRIDKRHFLSKRNAFIPPHLYGQLAQHKDGCNLLNSENISNNLVNEIKNILNINSETTNLDDLNLSELSILKLKSCMWALSHIGSTYLGFNIIAETDFIQITVNLAANSNILSLRATAFYCLGLISSTKSGSDYLTTFGWQAIRHNRLEKWPLFKEFLNKKSEFNSKKDTKRDHTSSVSSAGTRTTDLSLFFSHLNDKIKTTASQDLVFSEQNTLDVITTDEENIQISKSLPFIDSDIAKSNARLEHINEDEVSTKNKTNNALLLFSPQHSQFKSDKSRPRSSSDCQQHLSNNKEGITTSFNLTNNNLEMVNNSIQTKILNERKCSLQNPNENLDQINGGNSSILPIGLKPSLKPQKSLLQQSNTLPIKRNNRVPSQHQHSLLSPYSSIPRRKISEPTGSMNLSAYQAFINNCNIGGSVYQTSYHFPNKNAFNSIFTDDANEKARSCLESNSGLSSYESMNFGMQSLGLNSSHKIRKTSAINNFPNHYLNNNKMIFGSNILSYGQPSSSTFTHSGTFSRNRSFNNGSLTKFETSFLTKHTCETSMPSILDTAGYATLSSIQRKKDRLIKRNFIFNNHFNLFSENTLNLTSEDNYFDNYLLNDLKGIVEVPKTSNNIVHDENQVSSKFFMGISIPSTLPQFFYIKDEEEKDDKKNNKKKESKSKIDFDANMESCFSSHLEEKCLLRSFHKNKAKNIFNSHYDKSPVKTLDATNSSIMPRMHNLSNSECLFLDEEGQGQIKKDVIKLICNLSACFVADLAERKLLNLKQKYPIVFQDICLYSEVCLYFSNYSFKLSARKFLQELFFDINFDQLYSEAHIILKRKLILSNNQ